jgi:peptidyl-prolyl cis-trans isomerase SurA
VKQPNDMEYHFKSILISLPDSPSASDVQKAQQQADQLLKRIRSGEDFDKVATDSSNDQSIQAIDLDWRKLADMPAVFADAAKDMKVGEVKGPLRAPNGFHILKLAEVRQAGQKMKLDKEQAKALIYQQKYEEKVQIWLQKLRDASYIKIL